MHDILLLRISAILPEAISDGGLTPTTDTDLLPATCRGGSHLTSDISVAILVALSSQLLVLILTMATSLLFITTVMKMKKLIAETVPVLDFISMLTQHIPEKHFKMIRYYGLYARHHKSDLKLHRAISKEKHRIFLSFNRWRDCILHSFGYGPSKCPVCGEIMLFLKLYYRHKPVPLHELYERVMRKHRSRSPSIIPKSSPS